MREHGWRPGAKTRPELHLLTALWRFFVFDHRRFLSYHGSVVKDFHTPTETPLSLRRGYRAMSIPAMKARIAENLGT